VLGFLRALVRYLAAPVFFALAWIDFELGRTMDMTMAGMSMGRHVIFGYALPPAVESALMSMWLMYALMGLFQIGAWIDLMRGRRPG
jgi:hypothetical protein